MYSLVLMATMTTPTLVPDCHRHRCSGRCYGSYSGGCWGGGCHGGRGCYGGGYGCHGGGCHGGGCYGSSYYYGGSCYGGHGGYGCTGHYGCTGGATYGGGYYGAPMGGPAGAAMPAPAPGQPNVAPAPAPAPGTRPPGQGSNVTAPARIYVSLPADAKLYVDGQATTTANKEVRSFLTPDLEPGVDYVYKMRAEVTRNGNIESETRTVIVRAGSDVREVFGSLLSSMTASNR